MRWITAVYILCSAGVLSVASPSPVRAQDVTTDPDGVRLVVDDVRRLADVLHSLESDDDTVAVLERDYFGEASAGFRTYAERYGVTAEEVAAAVREHPAVYADLDRLADALLAQESRLRTGFRRLKELHPGAVFPPIWFVVGRMGPGGITRRVGVMIAAERYAEQPQDVVPLVLHELAHVQQWQLQGIETYRRIYGPDPSLLALALREGSAELIAELTTGRHINPEAERYGLEHESTLWREFREDMHDRVPGDWMFTRPADPDRPTDLGYWMGYRIAKSYYDRADDKRQAVHDILGLTDFADFLRESGYAEDVAQ